MALRFALYVAVLGGLIAIANGYSWVGGVLLFIVSAILAIAVFGRTSDRDSEVK